MITKEKAEEIKKTISSLGWQYIIEEIDNRMSMNIARLDNGENGLVVSTIVKDNDIYIVSVNANESQHEIKFWAWFKKKINSWTEMLK